MAAEYENFRKRSAKEREGVYADACADCIAALLPVLDNLERAAQYKSDDPATVAKGLEMTLKSFYDTLGKLGVNEIPAETFDPNLHNAVMHIEDDEHGESEIVEVLQKGFAKGDKVIRYAMVKVAN
jgi:molecular chaperone GrpE